MDDLFLQPREPVVEGEAGRVGIVRALARTAEDYYASLRAHGSNAPFAGRMFDFTALNERIGTEAMLAAGARYQSGPRRR